MQRGVIYFLLGNRHAVVTALSIRSLRQWYDGPLCLFWGDQKGREVLERVALATDGPTEIRQCPVKECKRHKGYSTKPLLPSLSPFESTIQLDGDTLIAGEFGELWPEHDQELVLTQFADWVSTGKRISARIRKWQGVAPEMVARQHESAYPAINTGVLAYGNRNDTACKRWDEVCDLRRGTFINDELAMQLLSLEPCTRVIDSRWNRSPLYYDRLKSQGPTKIWHFHGKKHANKPACWDIWGLKFIEAVLEDFAGMGDWAPAGDARLAHHLAGIGCEIGEPLNTSRNSNALADELDRIQNNTTHDAGTIGLL